MELEKSTKEIDPHESLCFYDTRSPYFDPENDRITGANQCFCDNCFYNRHQLAEEILRLREEMSRLTPKQDGQSGHFTQNPGIK